MCNFKQYLDRQYAATFLRAHGRTDLADIYDRIVEHCANLGEIIPQDFSAAEMFSDKELLRPYSEVLLRIRDLEEQALGRMQ